MKRSLFRSHVRLAVFRSWVLAFLLITLAVIVALLVNVSSTRYLGRSNCSFANACKVLAYLTGFGSSESSSDNRTLSFGISETDDVSYWFSDYYDYLCDIGMFKSEFNILNNPDRPLMESDLSYIYEYLDIEVKTGFNNDKAISNTTFISIIQENISRFVNGDKLLNVELGIVATSGDADSDSDVFDKPYTVSTNKGKYYYTGLTLTGFQDKTIEAFVIDDEILMITGVVTETTTFKNVWIKEFKDKVLYVNMYGVNRTFSIGGTSEEVSGMLADISLENGRVISITVKKDITDTEVRILLYNSDGGSIEHKNVTVTSDDVFYVETKECVTQYDAGAEVTVDVSMGDMTVTSSASGQIKILTLTKSQGNPEYEGKLYIYATQSGFVIVNEVLVENYLKRVVPSEMPSSYGVEALKVQAVCARSYAYAHLESYAYPEYEAHMDDTINFQVYNNTTEKSAANEAISATYGKMIYYGDTIVQAYYYSTSCGSGTDVSLWGTNTANYPYYVSKIISADTRELDLSVEANFRSFIMKSNEKDYDYGSNYYRWSVELTSAKLAENLKKSGYSDIGDITAVVVNNRVAGGGVNNVTVKGSNADVRLESEGIIRKVFELPSSFFVVDTAKRSGSTVYTFTGGGYGHGIGMSQNAVKSMAEQGMTYIEILKFFYNGISVF